MTHFTHRARSTGFFTPVMALLLALISAPVARSQIVDTGRITGDVQDVSGAVIPSVPVILRNTATNVESRTVTDSAGLFVSPPLGPGDYDVEVTVSGFNTERQHVTLEVAQRAALTVVLTPGSTSSTVDVEASAALLETESTTLSNAPH
jgi:hypothetical protein